MNKLAERTQARPEEAPTEIKERGLIVLEEIARPAAGPPAPSDRPGLISG